MKNTWRVELDLDLDVPLVEMVELLVEKYEQQAVKPILEVVTIGIGAGIADMLEDRKIPIKRIVGVVRRITGLDAFTPIKYHNLGGKQHDY